MFLITFNIPVPFTTLLEAFRTFPAKKWFLMGEVLSYPFKARLLIAAYKELISERPSFELRGASEKLHRPISCAKFDSGTIGDIFSNIRNL